MSAIINGITKVVAKQYASIVGARCAAMGLKYEDLLIEYDDVKKALARTEKETTHQREMRIKRAFDASAKKKTIPYENQPKDPMDLYLGQTLEKAKLEREEREILNGY